MRILKQLDFISVGLWASLWVVTFFVWPHVPKEIPTHWTFGGDVDGTSSRAFGLVFVPLLCSMIVGLMTLFVRAVWVKDSPAIEKNFRRVRQGVLALFAVLHVALVMAALGGKLDISRIVMTAAGIFLAYLALLLPKLPRNRWFGIRTKAALADDRAWKSANRRGSWAFALAGITTVLGAFLPPLAQAAILVLSVIAAAVVSLAGFVRNPNSDANTLDRSSPDAATTA